MLAPAALIERINREFRVNSKGTLTPIGKRRYEDREIAWARDLKDPRKIIRVKHSPDDIPALKMSSLDLKSKSGRKKAVDTIVELLRQHEAKRRSDKAKKKFAAK